MVLFMALGFAGKKKGLVLLFEAWCHFLGRHLQACGKDLGADVLHVFWGELDLIAGQLAKFSVGDSVGTFLTCWAIL